MLTPIDIQGKEFKKSFRGYDVREVDDFLNMVIKDYETLYRDSIDLKKEIGKLKESIKRYETLEDTLHSTLVVAQSTSDQIKSSANERAEFILKTAENKSIELISSAYAEINKLSAKYEQLKNGMDIYRGKMNALLNSQLELLNSVKSADTTLVELSGVKEALAAYEEKKAEEIIDKIPEQVNQG